MKRLWLGTTVDDVVDNIQYSGVSAPNPPLCVIDETKETIVGKINPFPAVEYVHLTNKWHVMQAYMKWLEGDKKSLPCLVNVMVDSGWLLADIGFQLFSKAARKRAHKAMRAVETSEKLVEQIKGAYSTSSEWMVSEVLTAIPWRASLEKGYSVASEIAIPWTYVTSLSIISDLEWLERYCTQGQYSQDWEKRDVDTGVVTPSDVNRQLDLRGKVVSFIFPSWAANDESGYKVITEIRSESKGIVLRARFEEGEGEDKKVILSEHSPTHFKIARRLKA